MHWRRQVISTRHDPLVHSLPSPDGGGWCRGSNAELSPEILHTHQNHDERNQEACSRKQRDRHKFVRIEVMRGRRNRGRRRDINGFGHIGPPSTNAKAILLLEGALAPATNIHATWSTSATAR